MRYGTLTLVLCASCSWEEHLAIQVPELAGAQSVIAAVERDDQLYVYAQDFQAGGAIRLPIALPAHDEARLSLMTYAEPLDAMDIDEGELVHRDSEPHRPLPDPLQHFEVGISDGTAGPVSPAERDAALTAFRIDGPPPPPPSACFSFESERIVLEGTREDVGYQGFAITATTSMLLVGTPNEELFAVTPAGETRVEVANGTLVTAGAIDETGQLWFADREGTLWRGTLGSTLMLEQVATSTMGGVDVLAVGGGEAFAVTQAGMLVHYDGVRWRGLYSICSPELDLCDERYRYRLLRLGPGEAVVMRFKGTWLVHYREGRIVTMRIPHTDPLEYHARALSVLEGFGVAVGVEGQVLRFDPAMDAFPEEDSIVAKGFAVFAIARFRGGYVLAGSNGSLTSFIPDEPACPSEPLIATEAQQLLVTGGVIFAIGERIMGATNALPITVLTAE